MNTRNKMNIFKVVAGIALFFLLGFGLSSFFLLNKLSKAKVELLQRNAYHFERGLEDVKICLDAEQYTLAQVRLEEAIALLESSQKMATGNEDIQRSFEIVCKKYCKIWNDPKWNYHYRTKGHPVLQKGFVKFCK
jgi:hypothetical protein